MDAENWLEVARIVSSPFVLKPQGTGICADLFTLHGLMYVGGGLLIPNEHFQP